MNDGKVPTGWRRRTNKVGHNLARQILQEITTSGLEPGTRLPHEAAMLERYQVGRGTLREALRILEVNGHISIKPGPGGGPIVEEASTEDFARMATMFFHARRSTVGELVEARLVMEPAAARMAADRRTQADIARLKVVAAFDQITDEDAYTAATAGFHELVSATGGNGVIAIFTQSLAEIFHARVREMVFSLESQRQGVIEVHAAIAQAIIDRDGDTAERLMFDHMQEYLRHVKKLRPSVMNERVDWMR